MRRGLTGPAWLARWKRACAPMSAPPYSDEYPKPPTLMESAVTPRTAPATGAVVGVAGVVGLDGVVVVVVWAAAVPAAAVTTASAATITAARRVTPRPRTTPGAVR